MVSSTKRKEVLRVSGAAGLGLAMLLTQACATSHSRAVEQGPTWASRLDALSAILSNGVDLISPTTLRERWPEPLNIKEEPQSSLEDCRGKVSYEGAWVRGAGAVPIRGSRFTFELRRGTSGEECDTRFSDLTIIDIRSSLADAKRAGDEFLDSVSPGRFTRAKNLSITRTGRWRRAEESDWLKGFSYYYGDYPPAMGRAEVGLSSTNDGWQVFASIAANYVDTW